ncbi:MAG: LVIVD repeat-containing protein [Promethearchaeota archaeon]
MKRVKYFIASGIIFMFILNVSVVILVFSQSNNQEITLREIGQIDNSGFVRDVVVKDDIAYIADMAPHGGLWIINVTNPQEPTNMGQFFDGGIAHHLFVDGDVVFVADNIGGLEILNVTDPFNPTKIGQINGQFNDLDVEGNIIYATDYLEGLYIFDVSNLTYPIELGRFEDVEMAQPVTIVDNLAYVTDNSGMNVLNVTDPSNITQLGQYAYNMSHIQINGDFAYLACSRSWLEKGDDGFKILDISNNFTEIGNYTDGGKPVDLYVADDIAIIGDINDGIKVLDIHDPSNITKITHYYDGGDATDIQVVEDLIFVADGYDGLEILQMEKIVQTELIGIPSLELVLVLFSSISVLIIKRTSITKEKYSKE